MTITETGYRAASNSPSWEGWAEGVKGADFLRILATQLSTQDPFEPMNNSEFMNQVVQVGLLERMESLNRTQALDWIGRSVRLNGEEKARTVEGLRFVSGGIYLVVDGTPVPVESVAEVR